MPGWIIAIAGTLGHVALGMLSSLMTEAFLKRAVVIGLEKLVKKTESEEDDKLLKIAKEAWKVED